MQQEIVPPKLNKDTGLFSLLLNRRNVIIGVGIAISIFLWGNFSSLSSNIKIVIELIVSAILIPFMFNFYGRSLNNLLVDGIKFYLSNKNQRILFAKEIIEGTVIGLNNQYSKIYKIEPINLFMSSDEEVYISKKYVQQALFSLKQQIQILTIQHYSANDEWLSIENERLERLSGKLKEQCKQYINEYSQINQTMDKDFYLILSTVSKDLENANRKLEEQNQTFGSLLEQSKIKLTALSNEEIFEVTNYLLNLQNV